MPTGQVAIDYFLHSELAATKWGLCCSSPNQHLTVWSGVACLGARHGHGGAFGNLASGTALEDVYDVESQTWCSVTLNSSCASPLHKLPSKLKWVLCQREIIGCLQKTALKAKRPSLSDPGNKDLGLNWRIKLFNCVTQREQGCSRVGWTVHLSLWRWPKWPV